MPTPLAVYRLLPKTNCRDCGLRSCMAFAVALLNAEKRPDACPYLSDEARAALIPLIEQAAPNEGFRETIASLKAEVERLDLAALAEQLGAGYKGGLLHIQCLGKDFAVADSGQLRSDCHVNVWVELMLLNYIVTQGRGGLTGRWVSYGDLKNAQPTAAYFERRCEEPMRGIADAHTGIFIDLLEIFGGVKAAGFDHDYAYIIRPLPMVPFLVLYTAADGAIESRLRILMDSSVTGYIPREALTYIGRGIVEMFKKIVSKHQSVTDELLFM